MRIEVSLENRTNVMSRKLLEKRKIGFSQELPLLKKIFIKGSRDFFPPKYIFLLYHTGYGQVL